MSVRLKELNNRPITALPSSPDDWTALTPNAILTGSLADDVPPDKFLKADAYRNSWKNTQYLLDKFWKQWLMQYLPLLQPKQKWFGSTKNFQVGDLVLMLDENYLRGQWPKALVTNVMPDKTGLVRRVRVRKADGAIYCRDIRKLCLLEGHTTGLVRTSMLVLLLYVCWCLVLLCCFLLFILKHFVEWNRFWGWGYRKQYFDLFPFLFIYFCCMKRCDYSRT